MNEASSQSGSDPHQLIRNGAVGVIASHDTGLSAFKDQYPGLVKTIILILTWKGDQIKFDYTPKKASAPLPTQVFLMKKMGIEIWHSLRILGLNRPLWKTILYHHHSCFGSRGLFFSFLLCLHRKCQVEYDDTLLCCRPWCLEWVLQWKWEDFINVIKNPKGVFVGLICHFGFMASLAFTLTKIFTLPAEIAGLILIGSCPSGLSSNIMAFLAKANVALSITNTSLATFLSPVLTPFLMKSLGGDISMLIFFAMMIYILKIIVLPISVGYLINTYFKSLLFRWAGFTYNFYGFRFIHYDHRHSSRTWFIDSGRSIVDLSIGHTTQRGLLFWLYCSKESISSSREIVVRYPCGRINKMAGWPLHWLIRCTN